MAHVVPLQFLNTLDKPHYCQLLACPLESVCERDRTQLEDP